MRASHGFLEAAGDPALNHRKGAFPSEHTAAAAPSMPPARARSSSGAEPSVLSGKGTAPQRGGCWSPGHSTCSAQALQCGSAKLLSGFSAQPL